MYEQWRQWQAPSAVTPPLRASRATRCAPRVAAAAAANGRTRRVIRRALSYVQHAVPVNPHQVTLDFKLALPQIAVVGSQSSGKSSVLEALVRSFLFRASAALGKAAACFCGRRWRSALCWVEHRERARQQLCGQHIGQ